MAAFSLTSTSIKMVSGGNTISVTAAETIAAGQAVTVDGYVVDAQDSDKLTVAGSAIQNATTGGVAVLAPPGSVIGFSDTLTFPRTILADSGGQLQYESDLTSGDAIVRVGLSITANQIRVEAENTGYSKS